MTANIAELKRHVKAWELMCFSIKWKSDLWSFTIDLTTLSDQGLSEVNEMRNNYLYSYKYCCLSSNPVRHISLLFFA